MEQSSINDTTRSHACYTLIIEAVGLWAKPGLYNYRTWAPCAL